MGSNLARSGRFFPLFPGSESSSFFTFSSSTSLPKKGLIFKRNKKLFPGSVSLFETSYKCLKFNVLETEFLMVGNIRKTFGVPFSNLPREYQVSLYFYQKKNDGSISIESRGFVLNFQFGNRARQKSEILIERPWRASEEEKMSNIVLYRET